MKKLLIWCLSIALLFSFLLPLVALAAQTDEPDESEAAQNGDAKAIDNYCPGGPDCDCEPYDPYDDEYYGYRPYSSRKLWEQWDCDTPEEFMELYLEIVLEYDDEYISPDLPFWREYASYAGSLEEFLIMYNLDMDDYMQLEAVWNEARSSVAQRMTERLVELGGTADIVNIMYNGKFLQFPDSVPELADGTTYIPALQFFQSDNASWFVIMIIFSSRATNIKQPLATSH